MEKILVTGGAGYIGSTLVPKLLQEGFEVTVVDNFYFNNFSSLLGCCKYENFEIIEGDARDEPELRVARAIDLAHAPRTDGAHDLIWSQTSPRGQPHRCPPAWARLVCFKECQE
jgi:nucleoside-diphosphate-sugar epimerase